MASALETREANVLLALSYDEAQLLANLVAAVDSDRWYNIATAVRDALESAGVDPDASLRAVVAERVGGPYVTYADFWLEDASDEKGV